jgi:hypothetical protein
MSRKEVTKDEQVELEKPFDFDSFELNTLEDYAIWNLHAHKAFRNAKKHNPRCDPPVAVRVPNESFHKKVKVKFQRFDQPENVLKVKCRTKDIDWQGQLKPGCTYELPLPVVRFLNNLAVPIFAEVKVENGGETKTETKQVGERNRFSCHLLELV